MKLQKKNILLDDLFELLDNNLIVGSFDKKVSEKILAAENDWETELYDLNDFIDSLKNEIKNDLTKENLRRQINLYLKDGFKKSTWNIESLETLIEVFDYSNFSDLEKIFNNLSDKLLPLLKNKDSFFVNAKGYPIIKIFKDKFLIKGITDVNFKTFRYADIENIIHYNPNKNSVFMKIYSKISLAGRIFSKNDNWILRISLKNGGDWKYKTKHVHNDQFSEALRLIKNKLT